MHAVQFGGPRVGLLSVNDVVLLADRLYRLDVVFVDLRERVGAWWRRPISLSCEIGRGQVMEGLASNSNLTMLSLNWMHWGIGSE